jgi:hypothetical protein
MNFERLNQIARRQRYSVREILLAAVCLSGGVMEVGLFLAL